jgi:hypothetical protein
MALLYMGFQLFSILYILRPRCGIDREADGVVEGLPEKRILHLGQNISTPDVESLLTASRSLLTKRIRFWVAK